MLALKVNSIYFHPGIYRIEWPYLSGNLIHNEQIEVKVYTCDVELRVGQKEDMDLGNLVTVIITARPNTPGVQNFIENIATKIRIAFFDHIFIEKHWEKPLVPEHRIRWIERHLFSLHTGVMMDDEINEVTMQWDAKEHRYYSPSWKRIVID